tara:strand:+ start:828 stop:1523 length:696 start_codon:yes stop_codon:yes gene_type:complete
MNEHAIMPPLSQEWIIWNSVTLFFILAVVFFSRNSSQKNKSRIANSLALLVAVEFIAIQGYYIHQGLWTPQDSLPFHLCRLMWFNSMIVLLTRNQVAFELLLFVGMIGGLHSLLTPEFTHGTDPVVLIDYFFVHGGLIAVPMYCVFVLGMRPRKMSWVKACLYLQVFVVSVGLINYFLGANYMYLAIKPNVENPFLIGDWPYYIIGLEIAVVLHALLVYLPFYFKKAFLIE